MCGENVVHNVPHTRYERFYMARNKKKGIDSATEPEIVQEQEWQETIEEATIGGGTIGEAAIGGAAIGEATIGEAAIEEAAIEEATMFGSVPQEIVYLSKQNTVVYESLMKENEKLRNELSYIAMQNEQVFVKLAEQLELLSQKVEGSSASGLDYDKLAEAIEARKATNHFYDGHTDGIAPAAEERQCMPMYIDYDLLAKKIADCLPPQEIISADYIASKVAEQVVPVVSESEARPAVCRSYGHVGEADAAADEQLGLFNTENEERVESVEGSYVEEYWHDYDPIAEMQGKLDKILEKLSAVGVAESRAEAVEEASCVAVGELDSIQAKLDELIAVLEPAEDFDEETEPEENDGALDEIKSKLDELIAVLEPAEDFDEEAEPEENDGALDEIKSKLDELIAVLEPAEDFEEEAEPEEDDGALDEIKSKLDELITIFNSEELEEAAEEEYEYAGESVGEISEMHGKLDEILEKLSAVGVTEADKTAGNTELVSDALADELNLINSKLDGLILARENVEENQGINVMTDELDSIHAKLDGLISKLNIESIEEGFKEIGTDKAAAEVEDDGALDEIKTKLDELITIFNSEGLEEAAEEEYEYADKGTGEISEIQGKLDEILEKLSAVGVAEVRTETVGEVSDTVTGELDSIQAKLDGLIAALEPVENFGKETDKEDGGLDEIKTKLDELITIFNSEKPEEGIGEEYQPTDEGTGEISEMQGKLDEILEKLSAVGVAEARTEVVGEVSDTVTGELDSIQAKLDGLIAALEPVEDSDKEAEKQDGGLDEIKTKLDELITIFNSEKPEEDIWEEYQHTDEGTGEISEMQGKLDEILEKLSAVGVAEARTEVVGEVSDALEERFGEISEMQGKLDEILEKLSAVGVADARTEVVGEVSDAVEESVGKISEMQGKLDEILEKLSAVGVAEARTEVVGEVSDTVTGELDSIQAKLDGLIAALEPVEDSDKEAEKQDGGLDEIKTKLDELITILNEEYDGEDEEVVSDTAPYADGDATNGADSAANEFDILVDDSGCHAMAETILEMLDYDDLATRITSKMHGAELTEKEISDEIAASSVDSGAIVDGVSEKLAELYENSNYEIVIDDNGIQQIIESVSREMTAVTDSILESVDEKLAKTYGDSEHIRGVRNSETYGEDDAYSDRLPADYALDEIKSKLNELITIFNSDKPEERAAKEYESADESSGDMAEMQGKLDEILERLSSVEDSGINKAAEVTEKTPDQIVDELDIIHSKLDELLAAREVEEEKQVSDTETGGLDTLNAKFEELVALFNSEEPVEAVGEEYSAVGESFGEMAEIKEKLDEIIEKFASMAAMEEVAATEVSADSTQEIPAVVADELDSIHSKLDELLAARGIVEENRESYPANSELDSINSKLDELLAARGIVEENRKSYPANSELDSINTKLDELLAARGIVEENRESYPANSELDSINSKLDELLAAREVIEENKESYSANSELDSIYTKLDELLSALNPAEESEEEVYEEPLADDIQDIKSGLYELRNDPAIRDLQGEIAELASRIDSLSRPHESSDEDIAVLRGEVSEVSRQLDEIKEILSNGVVKSAVPIGHEETPFEEPVEQPASEPEEAEEIEEFAEPEELEEPEEPEEFDEEEKLVTVSDLVDEESEVFDEPSDEVIESIFDEIDEAPVEGEAEPDGLEIVNGGGVDFANMMKYNRSFIARIIQSDDDVKRYYGQVKNAMLAYKKVNSSIAWGAERFNKGRETIAKLKIRGKTLCLYLNLDPNEFPTSVYHQVDVSDNKSVQGTPMMVKIKSPLGARKAIRLIDAMLAQRNGEKRVMQERDYAAMYPYETIEELIDDGLVKDVRKNK